MLTTKSVNFDLVLAELLWFIEGGSKPNQDRGEIRGRMSLKRLEEIYGKPITQMWVGDAENFKKRGKAQFEGDLGKIYGSQWRSWKCVTDDGCSVEVSSLDQLADLLKTLKGDYTSRYMIVTAWNPAELHDMSLPACHRDFQCFVRRDENGKFHLSLHMNQRSCDMFLGVAYNIASYGAFTNIIAQASDMEVDELIITLGDYHVYDAHVEQAKEQLQRSPSAERPQLWINPEIKDIDGFTMKDFELRNYHPQGRIKAPVLTVNLK